MVVALSPSEDIHAGSQGLMDVTAASIERFDVFLGATMNVPVGPTPFLGACHLPETLLKGDADNLLKRTALVLQSFGETLENDENVKVYLFLLNVGIWLAQRSSYPDEDLVLVGLVAGQLALSGRMQEARDLAEYLLVSSPSSASATRRRLAWARFADVYHRVHNIPESLLAACCALSVRGGVLSAEQAWQETYLLARICRDVGDSDAARTLLERGRYVLEQMHALERYGHRLDTLEGGLQMQELFVGDIRNASKWTGVVSKLVRACRAALAVNDDLAPVASLLGQAIRHLDMENILFPPDSRIALESCLAELAEPLQSRIRAMLEPCPDVTSVETMLGGLSTVRYSEDLGFDLRNVAIVAARFLSSNGLQSKPHEAAFAVELLADHTVRAAGQSGVPIWIGGRGGIGEQINSLASYAKGLGHAGRAIHFLALNDSDRLVRVTVADGAFVATVFEEGTVFSAEALRDWRTKFPYGYGFLDDQQSILSNEARISVLDLGISDTRRREP